MSTSRIIRSLLGSFLAAAHVALAQPFALQVGEDAFASEGARDVVLFADMSFATVGLTRFSPFPTGKTHIVLHSPHGVPYRSWFLSQAGQLESDTPEAMFQDPDDGEMIVLIDPPGGSVRDLVKFNHITGAISWQTRFDLESNSTSQGMKLDGAWGVVAASAGFDPAILKFVRSTGLPALHERYVPQNVDPISMYWVDLALPDRASSSGINFGTIFAVGTAFHLDSPDLLPGPNKLVITRLDSVGNVIWCRAYDAPVQGQKTTDIRGMSIALSPGDDLHVTAFTSVPGLNDAVLNLKIDASDGDVIAASVIGVAERGIRLAGASLEWLPDGTLLTTGALVDENGSGIPAMWTINEQTLQPAWVWALDSSSGMGRAVIRQPGAGLLLVGELFFSENGPIGGVYTDTLVARASPAEPGPCAITPNLVVLTPGVLTTDITLQRSDLSNPSAVSYQVEAGDALFNTLCVPEPCPGDLTTSGTSAGDGGFGVPDGVADLSDLLFFVNAWDNDLGIPSPNPGSLADVTTTGVSDGSPGFGVPDGNVDLSDLLHFVGVWLEGRAACP